VNKKHAIKTLRSVGAVYCVAVDTIGSRRGWWLMRGAKFRCWLADNAVDAVGALRPSELPR